METENRFSIFDMKTNRFRHVNNLCFVSEGILWLNIKRVLFAKSAGNRKTGGAKRIFCMVSTFNEPTTFIVSGVTFHYLIDISFGRKSLS